MQLFGDLDILSFVRISRLNWIGQVNRMDSKRRVIQVFGNNPRGSRLRGRPKTDGGIVYTQILTNAKLQILKRGQKKELTGRSSLRKRRSALDCSAIEKKNRRLEGIYKHRLYYSLGCTLI